MKTPEEIKKGIRQCLGYFVKFVDACDQCPYCRIEGSFCKGALCHDAISYIEQMEKRANLNTLRDAIYEDAVAHGLWEGKDRSLICASMIRREVIELQHAAIGVICVQADGGDDTEVFAHYAEELADVIIMSLSVAGRLGIDIDAAVKRKMEINRARPWKHGKEEKQC